MNKSIVSRIAGISLSLMATMPAIAGDVRWSVSVGVPVPTVTYSTSQVIVVQPQPVHVVPVKPAYVHPQYIYVETPRHVGHNQSVIEYKRTEYPTQVYQSYPPVYVVQPVNGGYAQVQYQRHR